MPPESVWMLARPRAPARPANSSSAGMRAADRGVGDAEVAAVDEQVLGDGEIGVEVVELRHHADARARLARRAPAPARRAARSSPPSGSISPRHRRSVVVLPAPLGPSRPKHSPRRELEVDAGDHFVLAVALAQLPVTREDLASRLSARHWRVTMSRQEVQPPVEEMVGAGHARPPAAPAAAPSRAPSASGTVVVELAVDHERVGRHGFGR